MSKEQGFKVWTSERSSPIQMGPIIWDGTLPTTLPRVKVDTSSAECGAGWNYCKRLGDAFRIGGLWRTGRPNIVTIVEPVGRAYHRGDKSRAASLKLIRQATIDEIKTGIAELSVAFAPHSDLMTAEQLAWYVALGRPKHDATQVEASLRAALRTRGLAWRLEEFQDAQDARAARAAWAAWAARAAWDARDAWDAWDARAAQAAQAAQAARDAWDARVALTVQFTGTNGWIQFLGDKLTVGLREAYHHGLEIAIPTGPNVLGWAMQEGGAK